MTAPSAREINETVRYTLWAIVARESAPECDSAESSSQIQGWIDGLKIQRTLLKIVDKSLEPSGMLRKEIFMNECLY